MASPKSLDMVNVTFPLPSDAHAVAKVLAKHEKETGRRETDSIGDYLHDLVIEGLKNEIRRMPVEESEAMVDHFQRHVDGIRGFVEETLAS